MNLYLLQTSAQAKGWVARGITSIRTQRPLWIPLLLLGSYVLTYAGYRFAVRWFDPPAEMTVLVYRENFGAGTAVVSRSLVPLHTRAPEDIADVLTPDDKSLVVQMPLMTDVKRGDVARRSHFLGLNQDIVEGLTSDYRSVWLRHGAARHRFREGSHLDLMGPDGKRLCADVILLKNTEEAYLVAIKLSLLPDVLRAQTQGEITAALRYYGPSPKRGLVTGARIHSDVSWLTF